MISIEEKYKVVQQFVVGESARKMAENLGVEKITVGDWKKNQYAMERWYFVHTGP